MPVSGSQKVLAGIDLEKLNNLELPEALLFVNPSNDDNKVPFFVAIRTEEIFVKRYPTGERYIIPRRDYKEVEFWHGGEQIDSPTASRLWREHEQNPQKGVKK